ncbi:hypothetical protein E2C01_006495 [Portunus trituberculatus]|uniref:Uncharacterized protein n=1 Tax=Portunus trituberculatus TaxID=210409 RepID=A0A5B7CY13_PORTR|nr:hypothetical protein [Portunus trituberculatus]
MSSVSLAYELVVYKIPLFRNAGPIVTSGLHSLPSSGIPSSTLLKGGRASVDKLLHGFSAKHANPYFCEDIR